MPFIPQDTLTTHTAAAQTHAATAKTHTAAAQTAGTQTAEAHAAAPQTATPYAAPHHAAVALPADSIAFAADSTALDSLALDSIERAAVPVVAKDTIVVEPRTGYFGTPVAYEFRNDDYVTSLLLASFFVMAWVIAASWKFLRGQMRDFFYIRERPNLFTEREDTVLRGGTYLVVQTCFLISLLFFTISGDYLPDVFERVSPYIMLGAATLLASVYYALKFGLYSLVNHTFYSPAKCKLWHDTYLTSILITGCGLLPIVLQVVFFDLPSHYAALECVLLLSVIKILLLYKCYRIFFGTWLGSVHIILYFCALEIIPLGFFFAALLISSYHLPSV